MKAGTQGQNHPYARALIDIAYQRPDVLCVHIVEIRPLRSGHQWRIMRALSHRDESLDPPFEESSCIGFRVAGWPPSG